MLVEKNCYSIEYFFRKFIIDEVCACIEYFESWSWYSHLHEFSIRERCSRIESSPDEECRAYDISEKWLEIFTDNPTKDRPKWSSISIIIWGKPLAKHRSQWGNTWNTQEDTRTGYEYFPNWRHLWEDSCRSDEDEFLESEEFSRSEHDPNPSTERMPDNDIFLYSFFLEKC